MALGPGSRVGGFEILGSLGAGGMGEVYRARDTKLKREVALKVLPPDVADDPERLARFQREAELLASLNHPNIAHLYGTEEGVESAAGPRRPALVMELVEGETLEQRLARGAMSFDEARPIALQIIDALSFAHEQGVIHRDLKPANIKLTPDGAVKILDFGLAKALDPTASPAGSQANSPTITSLGMTRAGTFLGTAAYMSPEQARGIPVDKRADIWAFGIVLFEMLTGRRPFEGETVSDTLANVLRADADWHRLPPDVPLVVRRLLRRCIEKDRKRRLHDIADARFEIDDRDAPDLANPTRSTSSASSWLRITAAFAAGVALTALGAMWLRLGTTQASVEAVQFLISSADGIELDSPVTFSMSPDGQSILLRGFEQGSSMLFVRSMSTGVIRRLLETKNAAVGATWSPDSQWIVFARSGALYKIAVDGSRQTVLTTSVAAAGISWSAPGLLLQTVGPQVIAIPAEGGTPKVVLDSAPNTPMILRYPTMLPDGRRFLVGNVATGAGEILVASTDGAPPTRLADASSEPVYTPGWLLAVRDEKLLAWRFDETAATISGEAMVIRDTGVPRSGPSARVFSASHTGVLAIRNEDRDSQSRLTWFDRSGAEGAVLKLDRHCRNPEVSPGGVLVALECYDTLRGTRDIWIYDNQRQVASRFTSDPLDDSDPLWSPDGRTIAFSSTRRGQVSVFRKNAGGAAPEEMMAHLPGAISTMAWSGDGKHIAMWKQNDLMMFDPTGDGTMTPILASPFGELELQFSPDGRWISYSSDESGRSEIYVQPWPPNGERWRVSNDGGADARWRPDSKELFYLSQARVLMAVPLVTSGSVLGAGVPVRLFQTRIAGPIGSGHRFPYAVSRDGKRFLMYVSNPTGPPPSITVIVNWPSLIGGR